MAVGDEEDRVVVFVDPPARQRAGDFFDVSLGIILIALSVELAHGEEFEQFAAVVLVGCADPVLDAVEVNEHRDVETGGVDEVLEVAQRVRA